MHEVTPDFDVGTVDDREVGTYALDEGDETRHLRVICSSRERAVQPATSVCLPMKAMSTPPGARGPPSAVHRRPFLRIQASKFSIASLVRRRLGSATPWRMLWLFFVVRKTEGDGFGTYL